MKRPPSNDPAALRRAAEARLKTAPRAPKGKADPLRLQHELEVHQIELEMQNEELHAAQARTAADLEYYADLYDFAPVGCFNFTANGTIQLVNLAGATLVGVEHSRLVGRRFGLLVAAADQPAFSDFLARVFACAAKQTCRLGLATEGRPPQIVHCEATRSPGGQECRAVLMDITEQEQTKAELAASEARRRAIFETAPECVKLLAADGSLLEMNPAGLRMIEADSFQQVERHCVYPLVVAEHRAAFKHLTERVFAGESGTLEFQIVGLKGGRRWLETHTSPLRDAAGVITALIGVTRDISGRKQAEERLRVSHERFQIVARATNDAVWDWDLGTNALWWNEGYQTLFGYSPEETDPTIASWLKFIHPEDLDRVVHDIHASIDGGGQAWSDEYRFRCRDGTYAEIFDRGYIIRDAQGQPVRMIGAMQDITVRRQAEATLARQHALLSAVVEGTGDAVFAKDLAGHYLIINTAGAQALGRPVEEILGHTDAEFVPEATARRFREADEAVVASGKTQTKEETGLMAGVLRAWHANKSPLRDAEGQIIGIIGVSRDITDRMQAEEVLRKSEERFAKVFHASPVSIAISTYPDGRYVDVNEHFTRTLGYGREEVVGRRALDFGIWADPGQREEIIRRIAAGETVRDVECLLRAKSGELRVAVAGVERIVLDDQPCLLFINVDITERKLAEQQLAESGELLRALLARLRLAREEERVHVAREIHDELGQLLTGLKMDVRWLERKLSEPGLPPELNPLLDRAVAASELADTTIATVQKIAAELRSGALDQLGLEAALTQEARRFQERTGIPCTVSVAESWPAPPPEIANELFYICQEALTNITRHASAKSVSIALRTEGANLVLEVSDDGVGMAEADLHARRSLGLTGMRERAVQCGGTVAFTRNEPGGTRVVVRVPLKSDGWRVAGDETASLVTRDSPP